MSASSNRYDYIIAGAGCAGLSLVTRMVQDPNLKSKRILLIDREEKSVNDRTWCFWETRPGFFQAIVHKSWDALDFVNPTFRRRLDIGPYKYKMIRSADFYRYCNKIINESGTVDRLKASIDRFSNEAEGVVVVVGNQRYSASYLFNSTLNGIDLSSGRHIFLRQHFRGWVIKTQNAAFDPEVGTLMDFRTPQNHGTAFFYTLPLSPNRALVEYTLFTRDMLRSDEYTFSLRNYIANYITEGPYEVEEEENGVIPMTNYPFRSRNGNIINIGTAGGQTKASTGYTFQFIQRACDEIVWSLSKKQLILPSIPSSNGRFARYDSILLRVLDKGEMGGVNLFSEIFSRGNPITVLRFLDNQSDVLDEIGIMWRMPKGAFLMAAMKELFV